MKEKIVSIDEVKEKEGMIHAVITTEHLERVVQRPYKYTLEEWAGIMAERTKERRRCTD